MAIINIISHHGSDKKKDSTMIDERNWAGNYQYGAARLHCPETVAQVQDLAGRSRKVKALGTRHSFNAIADTSEDLVSLANLNSVVGLDTTRQTVTVEAGIRYGTLCQYLSEEGFTLHNLASLPHISAGGACATGTHGSGSGNGSLAAAVSALEMVTADGALRTFSPPTGRGYFCRNGCRIGRTRYHNPAYSECRSRVYDAAGRI